MLTVLITSYQRLPLLKRLVVSIKKQTFVHYEVIIIDDNSGIPELSEYLYNLEKEDRRFKVFINKINKGYNANIAHAIKYVKGNYLLKISDDDYITDTYFEHSIRFLEENLDYVGAYGTTYVLDEKGRPVGNDANISLEKDSGLQRHLDYLKTVVYNGMYSGIYRFNENTKDILSATFRLSDDWIRISKIVYIGKIKNLKSAALVLASNGVSSNYNSLFNYYKVDLGYVETPQIPVFFEHVKDFQNTNQGVTKLLLQKLVLCVGFEFRFSISKQLKKKGIYKYWFLFLLISFILNFHLGSRQKIHKISTFIRSRVAAIRLCLQLIRSKNDVIIQFEHLGDVVASTGIARYISTLNNKKVNWIVSEKYSVVLKENPFIDKVFTIPYLGTWLILQRWITVIRFKKFKSYNLHVQGKTCNSTGLSVKSGNFRNSSITTSDINLSNYLNYGSLVSIFSRNAGLKAIGPAPELFLKLSNTNLVGRKYVLIHTTSNEEERNWNLKGWNELVNYLLENTSCEIIEVGLSKQVFITSHRFHDCTGYKDIQEICSYVYNSKLFVGVESGFAHIANAYSKNSMILLGKYKDFTNYRPYSGYFEENEKDHLLRYNGQLNKMPFEHIEFSLNKKLEDIT